MPIAILVIGIFVHKTQFQSFKNKENCLFLRFVLSLLANRQFISTMPMTQKQPLLGLTLSELQAITKQLSMPLFTAKQMASWLYDKKVKTIDEMTNLSLKHRTLLNELYEVGATAPMHAMSSVDGTIKYLYQVGENSFVEAVYIPDGERATLCVSSQVGCKMNCKFCMTGKQGFTTNLSANQILNQIISLPECDKLTNVVMMGMGEPLDNLDEVLKALEILTAL